MFKVLYFYHVKSLANIAISLSVFILWGISAIAQPTFTHINNVNAAGSGTLYWEVFSSTAGEEFVRYEFDVYDLATNQLNTVTGPHLVGYFDDGNGNITLPTGWTTPSMLYDLTSQAHCINGFLVTTTDGEQTLDYSGLSSTLCSIHVSAVETGPDQIDLIWNSPYALSGESAGGDFFLEKLNEMTAEWETIAVLPDNLAGGSYTDNPGPCSNVHIYRVQQLAANGVTMNVSNVTDLVTGSGNNTLPITTHIDVDPASELAVVNWDYEVTDETLGYIIYMCTDAGSMEILQVGDPNQTSATIATSLASTQAESYRVAAFDCINEDGTPNPNAAGDCTTSSYMMAYQLPCTDKAQIFWTEPFGMAGGVDYYTIEVSTYNNSTWGAWEVLGTSPEDNLTFYHIGADMSSINKYRVIATSTEGHIARSNTYDVEFTYPEEAAEPQLTRASVMSDGNVEIVIETDPLSVEVSEYQIERYNIHSEEWDPILEIQSSTMGIPLTFIDTNVDTDSRSYRYRCLLYNECGVSTSMSNEAETIFLQGWRSEDPEAFLNSLIWTMYDDFPQGVGSYEVLRADSRTSTFEPLVSVDGNINYSEDYVGDLTHLPGDFCYRILALENSPTTSVNGAQSNTICLTEEPLIWIPDAFTPNNDGLNDCFPWGEGANQMGFVTRETSDESEYFNMKILSRWGDTIYETNSINQCWDGTAYGEPVPDGVYSVVVRILDGSGKWHLISQAVQVFKP